MKNLNEHIDVEHALKVVTITLIVVGVVTEFITSPFVISILDRL